MLASAFNIRTAYGTGEQVGYYLAGNRPIGPCGAGIKKAIYRYAQAFGEFCQAADQPDWCRFHIFALVEM